MLQRRSRERGRRVDRRRVRGAFAAEATRNNITPGLLASLIVQEFSANASFYRMAEVDAVAAGADQPILAGLRHILIQSGVTRLAPSGDNSPKTAGDDSVLMAPGAALHAPEKIE